MATMEERFEVVPPTERPVQWMMGMKVALGTAALFWLVTRGIPWAGSGLVSPTVMGREIKFPGDINSSLSVAAITLHFVVAALYASLMMPLIHRFRYGSAALVGAAIGVILYLINLAVFAVIGDGAPYSRELPVFITHIAFGIVFTGAYKGLVKRRLTAEP